MKLVEKWKQSNEKWNETRKQIEKLKTKEEKIKEYNLLIMLMFSGIIALALLAIMLLSNVPFFYQWFIPFLVLIPFGGYSVIKMNALEMEAVRKYKATLKN